MPTTHHLFVFPHIMLNRRIQPSAKKGLGKTKFKPFLTNVRINNFYNTIIVKQSPKENLRQQELAKEKARREISSFFYPYYLVLSDRLRAPASQLGPEFLTPPPFRTYPHPSFSNEEIWETPPLPLVLNPNELPSMFPEISFHSALFRINFTSSDYLDKISFEFPLRQGSMIVFQGYNNTQHRHVVEWCQWIQEGQAYLKVVGIDRDLKFVSYNDPCFPSFILIVPIRFADVPIPRQVLSMPQFRVLDSVFHVGNQEENFVAST